MPKRNKMKKNILYSLLTIAVLITTGCESLDTTQFDQNVTGNNDGKLDSKYVLSPALKLYNGQAANIAIGQVDMTSVVGSPPDATIASSYGNAQILNGKLFLQSSYDNRILVYNRVPTESGTSADYVIGQENFLDTGFGTSNTDLYNPRGISITPSGYASKYSSMLIVPERFGHRVSIFNTVPEGNGGVSDVVVGQSGYDVPANTSCTAVNLHDPFNAITTDDGKLIIADADHNRVLIYNKIPTSNGAAADIVIGQADFTSCSAHNGASGLFFPTAVWTDGRRLAVVDSSNHRVLIWKTFPTSNNAPADIVLGQSNFNNTARNDDNQDGVQDATPTARTLDYPYAGIMTNSSQFFISDYSNHRVLVWNTFPTENFQPADTVLGQTDFFTRTPGISATKFHRPSGLAQYKNDLIVTDSSNRRYVVFSGN